MIHIVLLWLWSSAFAQFGLAGIVLIGAVAAFLWLGDVPGVRHASIAVASVCLIFLFLAPKLYIEGIRYEKAKWDAAELAATKRATSARQEAEAEVPALPSLPALPEKPPSEHGVGSVVHRVLHHARRVRGDAYDRDNR